MRKTTLALALAALQAPAFAADYSWQNGSGFWDDPSHWTLLGVPGGNDRALINAAGSTYIQARDARSLGELVLSAGWLSTTSTLTVGSLQFNGGIFGTNYAPAGGVMNVLGGSSFNGTQTVSIGYSHILNLGGNAGWTAGNGRLAVDSGYWKGSEYFATAQLNIGAGTVFTDAGAASAGGYKIIGGGDVNNSGTYLRTGLGETYARSFHNTGTLDVAGGSFIFEKGNWINSSSGTIKVAAGSTLVLAHLDITAGQILNQGLIRQDGNDVTIAAGVQIGGAWQVDSGRMFLSGTHSVDSLVMNGTQIAGPGLLNTGSLAFNYGRLGGTGSAPGAGLAVSGSATLNGASSLDVDYGYALALNGGGRWTADNGYLAVASSSTSGPAGSFLIGAGSTFADEGAAPATGTKIRRGGGIARNEGTYVRSGLGATELNRFSNAGLMQIQEGVVYVDAAFSNTGQVDIASGALLAGFRSTLVNDGLITGNGILRTFRSTDALTHNGTLDPGQAGTPGRLTIDGGLVMSEASVLHIDLGPDFVSDMLQVNGGAVWNGTLTLDVLDGVTLNPGNVYVVALNSQRLFGSSFDAILWQGPGTAEFSLEYTADSVLLRVTAAAPVPEPATYALWLLGLGLFAGRKWRASRRA